MQAKGEDNRSPSARSVRYQYENWPFPGTNFRSKEWLLLLRQVGKMMKDDGNGDGRFIDIGCGTGHTVLALAKVFSHSRFWGIDFSRSSIVLAKRLARENRVKNVTFRKANILSDDLSALGKFRVSYCAGVLHHIEDISTAFARVANLAAPGGYLIFWLYGKHGRARHRLNQQFLKALTSGLQPARALALAREFTMQFKDRIAADGGFYTPEKSNSAGIRWMLNHPSWLADQMLPGFENAFDLSDIFKLLDNNGMVFDKWLGISDSITGYTSSKLIQRHFAKLAGRERLLAIECLVKPSYYFVMAKKT